MRPPSIFRVLQFLYSLDLRQSESARLADLLDGVFLIANHRSTYIKSLCISGAGFHHGYRCVASTLPPWAVPYSRPSQHLAFIIHRFQQTKEKERQSCCAWKIHQRVERNPFPGQAIQGSFIVYTKSAARQASCAPCYSNYSRTSCGYKGRPLPQVHAA